MTMLYRKGDKIEVHPADVDRLKKQGWSQKAPAQASAKTPAKKNNEVK